MLFHVRLLAKLADALVLEPTAERYFDARHCQGYNLFYLCISCEISTFIAEDSRSLEHHLLPSFSY